MPRKKSSNAKTGESTNATNKPKRAAFKGFVNYTPTAEDKAEFERILAESHDPQAYKDAVLEQGYKISTSYLPDDRCFQSTLYGQDPTLLNAGLVLSARAVDSYTAEQRVLFLHIHVLEDDWNAALDTLQDDQW